MKNKVNILGTEYQIRFDDANSKDLSPKSTAGYCSFYEKVIVVEDLDTDNDWKDENKELKDAYRNTLLRHEITHGFMMESGLAQNSGQVECWATNEEMIDWFAIQSPKIFKVFEELDIL